MHPPRSLDDDVRAMKGPLERPGTIRLLVADNHPAIRAGIVGLIEAEDDMTVVAQAGDGRAAVEAYRRHVPDLTLLDLRMTMLNGLGATVEIRARWPSARIVVLASHGDDMQAAQALGAGACGYLLKTMIRADILTAIRTAHAGQTFGLPALPNASEMHPKQQELSSEELEILRRVASSGSSKLAAAEMCLPEAAVDLHMEKIMAKLEAGDRVQAVMIALCRGIIDIEP